MAKKKNIGDISFHILNYLLFFVLVFVSLYPFYYIFIYSLSDPQLSSRGIFLLPVGLTLENYAKILARKEIYGAMLVSFLRTVAGTVVTVFCCALFSYVLTKKELYCRKLIYRLLIVTMYLNAGLIPTYLTIRAFGLRNNFLVYILPAAINAFYVVLIKTYMESLPDSLEESAMLDGAGYFTVFMRVVFPLCSSIMATVAVFSSVGQFNSWFDTYIYASQTPSLHTLQYLLLSYLQEAQKLADLVQNTATTSGTGTDRKSVV